MAPRQTAVVAAPTNPFLSAWRSVQSRVAQRTHAGLQTIRKETDLRNPAVTNPLTRDTQAAKALMGGAQVLFAPIGGTVEGLTDQVLQNTPLRSDSPLYPGDTAHHMGDLAEMVTPLPGEGAVNAARKGVNLFMKGAEHIRPPRPRPVEPVGEFPASEWDMSPDALETRRQARRARQQERIAARTPEEQTAVDELIAGNRARRAAARAERRAQIPVITEPTVAGQPSALEDEITQGGWIPDHIYETIENPHPPGTAEWAHFENDLADNHFRDGSGPREEVPADDGFSTLPRVNTLARTNQIAERAAEMPTVGKLGSLTVSEATGYGNHHFMKYQPHDANLPPITASVDTRSRRPGEYGEYEVEDPEGHILHIGMMGTEDWSVNAHGPRFMRDIMSLVRNRFPNVKLVSGTRVSGARGMAEQQGRIPDFVAQNIDVSRVPMRNHPQETMWPTEWPYVDPATDPLGDGFMPPERLVPLTGEEPR